MPNKLLTATDVADALNVTPRTVATYCETGVFPNAFKLGEGKTAPWRIPQEDFDSYLVEQKKRAQPEG